MATLKAHGLRQTENGFLKDETLDVDVSEALIFALAAGTLNRDEVTAKLRWLVS